MSDQKKDKNFGGLKPRTEKEHVVNGNFEVFQANQKRKRKDESDK